MVKGKGTCIEEVFSSGKEKDALVRLEIKLQISDKEFKTILKFIYNLPQLQLDMCFWFLMVRLTTYLPMIFLYISVY